MSTVSVKLTVQFLQNLNYLHLATGASRLVCEAIKDLSESFVNEVEPAVSEACTNAIKHGTNAGASARVTVSFRVYDTQLVIEVGDQGAGFDFEGVPEPEFDQHSEGGYGLYIIRSTMDEVQYRRGGEMNILTMKKHLGK